MRTDDRARKWKQSKGKQMRLISNVADTGEHVDRGLQEWQRD